MFQLTLILAATVALGVHGQTSKYFSICRNNTMVKYPAEGPSRRTLLSSGVNKTEIDIILKKHNELRSRVALGKETRGSPGPQPSAANMRKMSYDDELAMTAQRLADQVPANRDSCRKVDRFTGNGQNVYMGKPMAPGSKANWTAAMAQWFDQVTLFNNIGVLSYKNQPKTLEYAQAVWADTYLIGCGFAQFQTSKTPKWTQSFYVCNYAAAGNIKGGSMYKVGTACTKCPTNTTCSAAEGLCFNNVSAPLHVV